MPVIGGGTIDQDCSFGNRRVNIKRRQEMIRPYLIRCHYQLTPSGNDGLKMRRLVSIGACDRSIINKDFEGGKKDMSKFLKEFSSITRQKCY